MTLKVIDQLDSEIISEMFEKLNERGLSTLEIILILEKTRIKLIERKRHITFEKQYVDIESSYEFKNLLNEMIEDFVETSGSFPEEVSLVAEGHFRNSYSKYIVTQPLSHILYSRETY